MTKLPEQAFLWLLAVYTLFLAADKIWSSLIFVGGSGPLMLGETEEEVSVSWYSPQGSRRSKNQDIQSHHESD